MKKINNIKDLNKIINSGKTKWYKRYIFLTYARHHAILQGIIDLDSNEDEPFDDEICNEIEDCWKYMTSEEWEMAKEISAQLSDLLGVKKFLDETEKL